MSLSVTAVEWMFLCMSKYQAEETQPFETSFKMAFICVLFICLVYLQAWVSHFFITILTFDLQSWNYDLSPWQEMALDQKLHGNCIIFSDHINLICKQGIAGVTIWSWTKIITFTLKFLSEPLFRYYTW